MEFGFHSTNIHEIWYLSIFFENLLSKFNFHYNLTGTIGILREDQYTFMIISSSILLKMKNVSDKSFRKIKTHFPCSIMLLENRTVYEIMLKNIVELGSCMLDT